MLPGDLAQTRSSEVLAGEPGRWQRPLHRDVGIVPGNRSIERCLVGTRTQIVERSVFAQDLKPVGEAFRDPQLLVALIIQFLAQPAFERWRARTDIHRDIEYPPATYPNQLPLRLGPLVM